LRCPDKFSDERSARLKQILSDLNKNPKPASYDMETAVLFRVAKDFGAHAASVLQTVNKERNDFEQAKEVEELFFFNYVLSALSKLN
jgi:uridine phosphorylase